MGYKILIPYGIISVYPPNPIIPIGLSTINTNVNSMVKKLKQGQKYPDGFTQNQILLKLCKKDKTPTSEIIDFLRDNLNIREQKNIREHHLKKLEKNKLIKRESAGRGHLDYWYVNSDPDTFAELLDRFLKTEHQKEFLASEYCKHMIRDWFPRGLVSVPPPMTDFMRSVFDADKKEFPDAGDPSFPIGAEIVSLAVPPDEMHRIVGENIIKETEYLCKLISSFYPLLPLKGALYGFLYDVRRTRQTFTAQTLAPP